MKIVNIMFFNQCEWWTDAGKANLDSIECFELARWFLKGQDTCSKPLMDAICSFCGALLHGVCNQHTALSNKFAGPPVNRDGKRIYKADGSPRSDAQPPFLLRWSPMFFAKEAPDMFHYNAETNAVSLRDGCEPPWMHKGIKEESTNTWLYCGDCYHRLHAAGKQQSHIPFRDIASKENLKPVRRVGKPVEAKQQAKFADDEGADAEYSGQVAACDPACGEVPDDEADEGDVIPEEFAVQTFPSISSYREKWKHQLSSYEKQVSGGFSSRNLCPKPTHRLWQDAPHVPFHMLKSVEAQSRLSVCRPHCALEEAGCADGVPRYAHIQGDVYYRCFL